MDAAVNETNRLNMDFVMWNSTLMSLLPTDLRDNERRYLTQMLNLRKGTLAAEAAAWWRVANQALQTDDTLRKAARMETIRRQRAQAEEAARLAADARDAERTAWEDAWERTLEWREHRHTDWPPGRWAGVDLGIVSVKYDGRSLTVAGGEILRGQVSMDLETRDLILGIGAGVSVPVPAGPTAGLESLLLFKGLSIREPGSDIGFTLQGSAGFNGVVGGVDRTAGCELWLSGAGECSF